MHTRYAVSGQGLELVLIHGVGLDLTMWERALPILEPHYRVVRYDLVGHGGTPALREDIQLADFVEQLEVLLDHLDVRKPHVLGFSLGGIIARGWAAAHPARIAKLVVLCSIAPRTASQRGAIALRLQQLERSGAGATIDAAIGRWFTPSFIEHNPEVIARTRATLLANQGIGYPAAYRFFATADDVIDGLGRNIRGPVLAITAEDDIGSTPEMTRRIAAETALGSSHVVPALRHMAVVESPEQVLAPVMAFLNGLSS